MIQTGRPIHIINVPLDLGASRRGTDAGPSAFRVAGLKKAILSLGYSNVRETDVSIPSMETVPPGDSRARYKDQILAACTQLAGHTVDALDAGEWPLVIGGDHSIAMGTVSAVSAHLGRTDGKLGVIWFDAHGDMNLPESSPSGNVHGMPLAHLLGYGDPQLSAILGVLIGIRDIDVDEREFIHASGVTAFTMREIDQLGMSRVAGEALEIVNNGTAGFHVSFDLDGCDPEVIPGTGTAVPGGVSFREAHLLLEECAADGRMTSMEVVELNPFLDHANISAERAVTLVQSALGRSIL